MKEWLVKVEMVENVQITEELLRENGLPVNFKSAKAFAIELAGKRVYHSVATIIDSSETKEPKVKRGKGSY